MIKQPQPSDEVDASHDDGPPENFIHGGRNPFPGLRPFSIEESYLYFGRDHQLDELLPKLAANRFIAVMGYSGSGKSSLMYCGLVPVLYGGFVVRESPNWHIITARPGMAPIHNLAEAVVAYLIGIDRIALSESDAHLRIISSILRSGQHGLVEVARFIQQETGDNIFILIDQFEELFRFRESEDGSTNSYDEAQHYINLLVHGITQQAVPVYTALTMRSDYIGRCSRYPQLATLINDSNYLVPQMTREQKKMVIEGPVAVAGGAISQRLVKKLLGDMGNDQNQLPLLQHALMRTWDYWVENREPGEKIDLRHYNAIGQMSQALSMHANEAYDQLSTREKEIAEVLFKNITEKNQDNRSQRRSCRLDLICELAEASEQEVIKVVDHFRQPGRSFLMPAANVALTGESLIELSHESMIRIWNRLEAWVEEEFDSARMYKRLSDASAMYQIGKTGLWRPPDLQLALNWQKKQKPTRAWGQRYDEAFERAIVFLDTSRITYEAELKNQEMMQRRVLQRTRATAIVLGVATLVAILFMLFAYMKMIEADKQTDLAQDNEQEALRQSELAISAMKRADALREREVKVRRELEQTSAERQKAYDEMEAAQQAALAALDEARHQKELALQARNDERVAKQDAIINYDRAQVEFRRANRLLILTKAQAMAAKSRQENDDRDLAGLLAMQAYLFHNRYEGRQYDPYVYAGLYYALTKLSSKTYNAIKVVGPPRNRIKSLAMSHQSNTFYAAGADGRIFKGDYLELSCMPTEYANPFPNRVVALSPNEQFLVNGTDSAFVQVFDLSKRGRKPMTVEGFNGATNDIVFMPDNKSFLVASDDRKGTNFLITEIELNTGEKLGTINLPAEVKNMSISKDGLRLVAGTWSGKIFLINLQRKTYTTLIDEPYNRILAVTFSPDGRTIAYGTDDLVNKRGQVKLYKLDTQESRQFSGHQAGVFAVAISPDGKLLASAGSDRKLQMWVLDHPEELPVEMDNNNGFIFDVAFSKGSDYLIAATSESEIRVWPTDMSVLADQICPQLTRNMTPYEWNKYVGDDIDFEDTCLR